MPVDGKMEQSSGKTIQFYKNDVISFVAIYKLVKFAIYHAAYEYLFTNYTYM